MIKYAEKYPSPGPRPAPEATAPALEGDKAAFLRGYGEWRHRAQDMTQWQTRRRQHAVAKGLDDIFTTHATLALTPWIEAQAILWLSYLNEPLPEEFFP